MLNVTKKTCCGCGACELACRHGAIKYIKDELGFSLPIINEKLCVKCGKCEKVCPFFQVNQRFGDKPPKAFAARHKLLEEVQKSRSGAVFVALTDTILHENGVVYGAGLDAQFRVVHGRAVTAEERDIFRGSKYAQSNVDGVYRQVLEDLRKGKKVLFSGTPCQVAALSRNVPSVLRANLLLVDIVCHGVSSPAVWEDWLRYVRRHERHELIAVNFRDKSIFGWDGLHRESFTFDNGKTHTYPLTYYQPFLIRESCYSCPFASTYRCSDITLGDFWGHNHVVPRFPKANNGVSLVLVNSEKGHKLFLSSTSSLIYEEVPLAECLQPNLKGPTKEDPRRKMFVIDYATKGFDSIRTQYWPTTIIDWLKYYVKRLINKQ